MNKLLYLLTLSLLIVSCGKNKDIHESEQTVLRFFKSLKENNSDAMKEHYPKITTFDSYFKSDSIRIKNSGLVNDSLITISILNYYMNGFGKQSSNDIKLYLLPDSLGKYSMIYDSHGLTDYSENELYSFAVKTGCIERSDSTDQQKNRKLIDAFLLQAQYTFEKLLEIETKVDIVDWSWETGYGGSASGKGIVKNNTAYDIPSIKYEVTYQDRNGNIITTDNGYVTYGTLRSGSSQSFTFYTSYVGNRASQASISLNFNKDMIRDYVLSANYNGDEYQEYLSENNK